MAKLSLPITRIIHENISVLMSFSFSRKPLEELVESTFVGEWKYLHKALFEIPEQRAEKACLELAMFMRLLDDEEHMSDYLKARGRISFGRLIISTDSEKDLSLRDVCNKILHASDMKWDLSKDEPILICNSQEKEKWLRAEIKIVNLAAYCGNLMI